MVRVFSNGPGDLGSIPGRVIPKTLKRYLMPPCLTLSIIRYGSRVKWRNPGKGVASSPTPWCSSYRKRCLRVTLDYGRQLYLLIYIYIYRERERDGWLVGFYDISTFVGYLTPNPFLCKMYVLFQTIQFSMSTQFNCQRQFYFKLFSLFKQF